MRLRVSELERENAKMSEALETTLGNIRSLKACVGVGVVNYDVWERVVRTAVSSDNLPIK